MKLPTIEECNKLIDEYKVPANIRRHSEKVRRCAVFLAKKLIEKGEKINIDLLERACILHDILKTVKITHYDLFDSEPNEETKRFYEKLKEKFKDMHHEDAAYEALKGKYPEVAEVIKKHRYVLILNGQLKTWEDKLLYYVDKRVMHDKIVDMKERLEEGQKRYEHHHKKQGVNPEEINPKIYELENFIFKKIGMSPGILNTLN